MIDNDISGRVLDAENHVPAGNARAVAAETRDQLREDVRRLEKEVSISCAIASELLSTLVAAGPQRAGHAFASVLSHYDRYRESPQFPNLSELLRKLARAR